MKLKKVAILFAFLLLLVSCGQDAERGEDINATVKAPTTHKLPLGGVWKLSKVVDLQKNLSSLPDFKVGDSFYLAPQMVAISEFITTEPSFSTKFVNLKNFLKSRYVNANQLPSFSVENTMILMIRDNDVFSLDLISLGEGKMAFVYESRLYYFDRSQDAVPEETVEQYRKFATTKQTQSQQTVHSVNLSTLIGVRDVKESPSEGKKVTYSTYLITDLKDQDLPLVYKLNGLYIPTEDGPTKLLTYQQKESATGEVIAGTFMLSMADDANKQEKLSLTDSKGRMVSFAHNNIISFEKPDLQALGKSAASKYEIHNLDRLSQDKPLRVDQIATEKEKDAFTRQMQDQLSLVNPEGVVDKEKNPLDFTNIGIVRQRVQWGYVSSMNWKAGSKILPSKVDINLVSRLPLFNKPEKLLDWGRVVNKQNLAISASESPKHERTLIQTDDELQYYKSGSTSIARRADLSIQTGSKSTIVLLEYFYDELGVQVKKQFLNQNLSQPQVIYLTGQPATSMQ